MNLPIGQLIQGASQARNAFVGGQQERQHDDLANALLKRKLEREDQEQSLRDALTRRTLNTPIAQPRDYVKEHQLNRDYDNANPAPKAPEVPNQQHVVDPVTGDVKFFDPKNPPNDLKVTPRPVRERPTQNGMTTSNSLTLQGHFNTNQVVKDSEQVATAYRKIRAASQDPSPAGDLSLLYGYTKLLDPNSVVRESEFATAAKSGSLPQQVQAAATKVINGQRLTPEQRTDFLTRAEQIARSQSDQFRTVHKRYSDQATGAKLDPNNVVYDPFSDLFEAARGGGKITPAERQALKAKGFTDAQITAKYGPP